MKIPKMVVTLETNITQSGITAAFFNFFQGRATTFAIVFAIVGIWLACHGKLDANYSLFVTAIQGLIFAHSCKEDWHDQRMASLAQQQPCAPAPPAQVVTAPEPGTTCN